MDHVAGAGRPLDRVDRGIDEVASSASPWSGREAVKYPHHRTSLRRSLRRLQLELPQEVGVLSPRASSPPPSPSRTGINDGETLRPVLAILTNDEENSDVLVDGEVRLRKETKDCRRRAKCCSELQDRSNGASR